MLGNADIFGGVVLVLGAPLFLLISPWPRKKPQNSQRFGEVKKGGKKQNLGVSSSPAAGVSRLGLNSISPPFFSQTLIWISSPRLLWGAWIGNFSGVKTPKKTQEFGMKEIRRLCHTGRRKNFGFYPFFPLKTSWESWESCAGVWMPKKKEEKGKMKE